jgi:hypothetical protein
LVPKIAYLLRENAGSGSEGPLGRAGAEMRPAAARAFGLDVLALMLHFG